MAKNTVDQYKRHKVTDIDFHGKSVLDAIREVKKIIDDTRIKRETRYYNFITGRGEINNMIKNTLDAHFIVYSSIPHNPGLIMVEVE